jgi:hypothetical protein
LQDLVEMPILVLVVLVGMPVPVVLEVMVVPVVLVVTVVAAAAEVMVDQVGAAAKVVLGVVLVPAVLAALLGLVVMVHVVDPDHNQESMALGALLELEILQEEQVKVDNYLCLMDWDML